MSSGVNALNQGGYTLVYLTKNIGFNDCFKPITVVLKSKHEISSPFGHSDFVFVSYSRHGCMPGLFLCFCIPV